MTIRIALKYSEGRIVQYDYDTGEDVNILSRNRLNIAWEQGWLGFVKHKLTTGKYRWTNIPMSHKGFTHYYEMID